MKAHGLSFARNNRDMCPTPSLYILDLHNSFHSLNTSYSSSYTCLDQIIEVIEQVAARSGMDSKMAELYSLLSTIFLYEGPVQANYGYGITLFKSPDPITPPAILTPSPVLPPSLLFDPRYFFIPEELLPPKKRICSPSSSSTTLSNPSRNQTRNLVSPSSSVYTPTPPQIFEIGKSSVKIHLKHHEEQIEDILNYLDELSFHRIEKMEEGRIDRMIIRRNSDELKTELKKIRTQIIKLQKKQLGQKDKIALLIIDFPNLENKSLSKSTARHQTTSGRSLGCHLPAQNQQTLKPVLALSYPGRQAATMAIQEQSNGNSGLRRTPCRKKRNYKEFIELVKPFYFTGTEGKMIDLDTLV
ncbi:hypothetical protein Tco_0836239 [Tanacetum coccineum]